MLENMPFDIPESWCWARLGKYISLLSGRDLEPAQYNKNNIGVPYITGASNFEDDRLIINRWTDMPVVISHKGDLLITCKGTIGTMAYNQIGDLHIARQIMAIRSDIDIRYVKIFLQTKITDLQAVAKSMIPGISRDDIEKAIIPIPPIQEQVKIVAAVEKIMCVVKDEA